MNWREKKITKNYTRQNLIKFNTIRTTAKRPKNEIMEKINETILKIDQATRWKSKMQEKEKKLWKSVWLFKELSWSWDIHILFSEFQSNRAEDEVSMMTRKTGNRNWSNRFEIQNYIGQDSIKYNTTRNNAKTPNNEIIEKINRGNFKKRSSYTTESKMSEKRGTL